MLLVLVPASLLVLYNASEQRRIAAGEVWDNALRLARRAAREHENRLEAARQLLAGLALAPAVQRRDAAACTALVQDVLRRFPLYTNVAAVRPNGDVFCSAVPLARPVNIADRAYFQRVLETREVTASDYLIGRATGKPAITVAQPSLDVSGAVQAVVLVGVDLAWFEGFAATSIPHGGRLVVIDREGTVLAHFPDPEKLAGTPAHDFQVVKTVLARREGVWEGVGLDSVVRVVGFTRLRGTLATDAAFVWAAIPKSVAYADIDRLLWHHLAALGLVALLAAGAAWMTGHLLLVRPLGALVTAATRVGAGDLTARARLPYTAGEFGRLARAFDEMAAALAREREALARQAAELARSNADLERFAYVASHDLQEPLRMVASYTTLLGRRYGGRLDADADEFIAYAVDGATRMQQLIDDLLAYSRVGTRGKDFVPTDCESVLDHALANLQFAIQESGAVVTREPLPTVTADAAQLTLVFQNLVGNAIKFRGAERPAIHVSAAQRDGAWVFAVSDNGIGIDPAYADRIFVVFQRLHGPADYSGTGIGLAISKRIVERHGGRIWVESEPGKGATFRFTIPATRGEPA